VLVAAEGLELDGANDSDSPLHAVMAQKDPQAGPRMALALINAGAAVDHPGKKGYGNFDIILAFRRHFRPFRHHFDTLCHHAHTLSHSPNRVPVVSEC